MAQANMKIVVDTPAEPYSSFGIRLFSAYDTLFSYTFPKPCSQTLHCDPFQRFSRLAVDGDERILLVGDESQIRHLNSQHQNLILVLGVPFGCDQKTIQAWLDRWQCHQGGMPQQILLFRQVYAMLNGGSLRH